MSDKAEIERPAKITKKALFGAFLSLGISVLCMWLVLRYTKTQANAWRSIFGVGLKALVMSLAIVVLSWLADSWRLLTLASAMTKSISFWDAFKISIMGSFMAGVTPFDTGGEPLKIYFLHKKGLSIGESTAVVTLGAFLHATSRLALWVLVPAIMLVRGISWQFTPIVKATLSFGLLVYLAFLSLMALVTFWPGSVGTLVGKICGSRLLGRVVSEKTASKIIRKAQEVSRDFKEGIERVRQRGGHAVFAAFLSIAYWILVISVPIFLLRGMAKEVAVLEVFSISMTVYLVMAYMPTPGASGGAEVGSAIFFAPLLPQKILGVFVVAWRFITYYLTLLVGGVMVVLETIKGSVETTKLAGLNK